MSILSCHERPCWARVFENAAISAGGVLIYAWYALLRQRPKVCICTSDMCAALAEVAAPILKLRVLKCFCGSPILVRSADTDDWKACLVM